MEQAEAFLDSDRTTGRQLTIEGGYLKLFNLHWGYVKPYAVLDGKAILFESDKNGSLEKT